MDVTGRVATHLCCEPEDILRQLRLWLAAAAALRRLRVCSLRLQCSTLHHRGQFLHTGVGCWVVVCRVWRFRVVVFESFRGVGLHSTDIKGSPL